MSNPFFGVFYNLQGLGNEIKNVLVGIGNLICLKYLYLFWDGIAPSDRGAPIGLEWVHRVLARDQNPLLYVSQLVGADLLVHLGADVHGFLDHGWQITEGSILASCWGAGQRI